MNSDNIREWAIYLDNSRREWFLTLIEPLVQCILGPLQSDEMGAAVHTVEQQEGPYDGENILLFSENDESEHIHRRLSFLPEYVRNVKIYQETSMSFATLFVLFFLLSCLMMVFLSCFYHNQKTSPMFISPRRHRLPNLVPPPLPVDSMFSWVQIILFMSDEEIISRIGYDALVFLRFHRLALRCIVKMAIFSILVLLPLNFTGSEHKQNEFEGVLFTDFMR